MKKASRLALISAGTLFAILAMALLALNLYVQSHDTQARIERELSERLGATLRIGRISVTPWWGLKLTGITMPQENEAVPGDFLKADTFRLRIRIASLFSRRLIIKEVSLVNPKVVWAQNEHGKWRLPASLAEGATPAASPAEPEHATETPAPGARQEAAPPAIALPAVPEEEADRPFQPEVRRVRLVNGSFRFLDSGLKPVATFDGVRFRSSFRTATALQGEASIARTSLRNRFFLEELHSPLKYDPEELDFSEISARAAGGEITGHFNMRPADPDSPFKVVIKFRGLEADRLVRDARGPEGIVQGRIEGHLDATGNTADPNALAGAGEIHLRDGEIRQYSLLVALGQLLDIDELRQLQLDEARVKYRITPGVVTIDELLLTSPNIRVSATGTIGFSGKLRLESQLAIHDKIRGRLFQAVRDNFQAISEPGYAAINFQVTGTIDRPKTNLMDKVVGNELRDLTGAINSLLGVGRSERRKKKAPPDAPPALVTPVEAIATPASTASPEQPSPTP